MRSKKNINDNFYKEKSGRYWSIPCWITKLENLRDIKKITKESAAEVLSAHKYLQNKIHEITGMDKVSLLKIFALSLAKIVFHL